MHPIDINSRDPRNRKIRSVDTSSGDPRIRTDHPANTISRDPRSRPIPYTSHLSSDPRINSSMKKHRQGNCFLSKTQDYNLSAHNINRAYGPQQHLMKPFLHQPPSFINNPVLFS